MAIIQYAVVDQSPDTVNVVTWLRNWSGIGLASYRSQVGVLSRHHCIVAFGKLLTLVCLCYQAV